MKRLLLVVVLIALGVILLTAQQQNFPNGSSGGLPTGLTFAVPTLTVSTAGSGNGVVALSGNTSGTATITAPAIAGTSTNPLAISNVIAVAAGTSTSPSFGFIGDTSVGWFNPGAGFMGLSDAGNFHLRISNSGLIEPDSGTGITWISTANNFASGSFDSGVFRQGAGVVEISNSSSANSAGVILAAAYRGGGAAAGLTGTGACATFSGQVGGSSTGSAACASATGAATLTITPGTTAPNGWVCSVYDETTRANLLQQTSHNGTTCTLTSTNVNQNDVFVFTAFQF